MYNDMIRTIRLALWLIAVLGAIWLIPLSLGNVFKGASPETLGMIERVLSGSGYANMVTFVLALFSIAIAIAFFIFSEKRGRDSDARSTEMLGASQAALRGVQILMEQRFDKSEKIMDLHHAETISALTKETAEKTKELDEKDKEVSEALTKLESSIAPNNAEAKSVLDEAKILINQSSSIKQSLLKQL